MDIIFNKLYRYDRKVNSYIAIPFAQGGLMEMDKVQILQDGKAVPVQKKVTSRYKDGSIRYLFLRFLADIPGNQKKILQCEVQSEQQPPKTEMSSVETEKGVLVQNDRLSVMLRNNSCHLFGAVTDAQKCYQENQFQGPFLKTGDGKEHGVQFGIWKIQESGPVYSRISCKGKMQGTEIQFECSVEFYAESSDVEISYRLINTTDEILHVKALYFAVMAENHSLEQGNLELLEGKEEKADSTGCGDGKNVEKIGDYYVTTGIKELPRIEQEIGWQGVRTCAGRSNYKTNFQIGKNGAPVHQLVDADSLVAEANEHYAEVFYGTFFADRTEKDGGVSATIYQAQQNFPKAVKADESGLYVMLVPEGVNQVTMETGMAREQKFLLHFHASTESLVEIDNQSLMYQMKDRPYVLPEVFKRAGVMPDIFPDAGHADDDVEIALIQKCDGHARSYGMMCWGDTPDMNYTTQGRGKGMLVWSNNEYDFPHACAMQYARTGERRFLDYMITAAKHWMDVDVCHYSRDSLRIGGQWEHTRRHVRDGVMVCSHEWVEGLIDYYHFTGEERGLETAIGIGNNVMALLDTPMYQTSGESNARETGWALRTLMALYVETHDSRWLTKCEWIVEHFMKWKEEYGNWLAPYTDNTTIRVGFMISVAVGSLMRYYREFPSEELKQLLLDAVDDLVENALLPNGLFYYKELPSLNRLGSNTLLLEALAIAYELTGEASYLEYGKRTFEKAVREGTPGPGGVKTHIEDAVVTQGSSTKNFAQSFLPMATYYQALLKEKML